MFFWFFAVLELVRHCAEYAVRGAVFRALHVAVHAKVQVVLGDIRVKAARRAHVIYGVGVQFGLAFCSGEAGLASGFYVAGGENGTEVKAWLYEPAGAGFNLFAEGHATTCSARQDGGWCPHTGCCACFRQAGACKP